MKRFLFLLTCCGAFASAADLAGAHTVYVLSMSRGLDQFLANRLTNAHILQVVTDPKLADVILTDHLGEAFQAKLETISPKPEPEQEKKPAPQKAEKKEEKDKKAQPEANTVDIFTPPVNKLADPALMSTFGRNKGTVFLVDAKSRQVLWSVYEPPKGAGSREMDRTAEEIVRRLEKDFKKK